MNKRTRIVSVLLGLALGAVLGSLYWPFGGSAQDNVPIAPGPPDGARVQSVEPTSPPVVPVAPAAPQPTDSARTAVVPEEAEAPEAEVARCVVFGRLVDEEDAPIEGVTVRLQAYKVWTEGVDVPRLPGPYDMRGFEVTTDAQGGFRFGAPVPTAERTSLEVRPDRFHDSHRVSFRTGRQDAQPPLGPGVRDLGEIRLATTGAVTGRVTDAQGRPLAEVEMSIGPGRSTTYQRDTSTASDGTYVVAHAPIGTYAVKAKSEGYISGYIEPVTVEAARDTNGIDFVLDEAPSIEGVVIDELGGPVEGAKLYGWPSSSGTGAGAKSGADGRFVLYLPQDEPYSLNAKCDGYEMWGEEFDRSITFEPGTRDLEVVMKAMPSTRFVVIDDESGERMTRFGLSILENQGSQASRFTTSEHRPPRLEEHPDGSAEVTAREGIDLFLISAENYLLASGDVAFDVPGKPLQTVRMRRGATVRGRVLRDGLPVAGASVVIEQGGHNKVTSRATTSGTDGRFELVAVEPGGHKVVVQAEVGAPLVASTGRIQGNGVHDLGDLSLLEGASISGRVIVPAGVEPAGLEVYLGHWQKGVKTVVGADARFAFEELAAGASTLALGSRPGRLAETEPVPIELEPGRELEVTLDATDRAMCAVTLTIDLGGLPVTDSQVDLLGPDGSNERERLGHCDAAGVVIGAARAWGEARVGVYLDGLGFVEHPELRLDLRPFGQIEERVRFEFASLELLLPPGVALPERGTVHLMLETEGRTAQSTYVAVVDGALSGTSPALAHAEPGRISFGALLPGHFRLTLDLIDEAAELERVDLGGGRFSLQKPAEFTSTREVRLTAGSEQQLRLE